MSASMLRANRPFNNPAVHTQSWYPAAPSWRVRRGKVTHKTLLGQRVALYRGESGRVYALVARCPHMGANLGDGKVAGEDLQCPFHHWIFAGDGQCVSIPSQETIPRSARTFSYPVEEKHGEIWIFNGPRPTFAVPTFPNQDRLLRLPPVRWRLNCHHHLIVSNAIDLNHWRYVHGFRPIGEPEVETLDDGRAIRVRLSLALDRSRRLFRLLRATAIEASIAIVGGNLAVIHAYEPWRFHILIAHRPLEGGRTVSKMFMFFPKKGRLRYWSGMEGGIAAGKLLLMGLLLLDDRAVLNNIDFWPHLTEPDALLAKFIQQVNKLEVFDAANYAWN